MSAATSSMPNVAREGRRPVSSVEGAVERATGSVLFLGARPRRCVVASWFGVSGGRAGSPVSAPPGAAPRASGCGAPAASTPFASTVLGAVAVEKPLAPAAGGTLFNAWGVLGLVAAGEGRSSMPIVAAGSSFGRTGVGSEIPISVALLDARLTLSEAGGVDVVSGAGACGSTEGATLGVASAGGLELEGRGGLDALALGRGGLLDARGGALLDACGGGLLDACGGGLLDVRGGGLLGGRGGELLFGRGGTLVRAAGAALAGATGGAAGTGDVTTELMPEFAAFGAGSSSALPQPSSSSSAW
jgi:hypothetical protein